MIRIILLTLSLLIFLPGVQAATEDDPLLFMVLVDKLEWRDSSNAESWVWDADAWVGKDLNKLWLKTEGERTDNTTESAFSEFLYSRAVSTYWDMQAGWRHDSKPSPSRDWFAFGLKGLAPYFFDVDATLYAGGNDVFSGRIDAEYEILFTQRLILSPEVELDYFSKDDVARGIGEGFSNLELGLRLRYEIRREFAPYIGVNWEKKLGNTADLARLEGEETDDLQFVLGIRAWF